MTCPSCQLAVDTHTTDQLRRCVLAKAAVPVSLRCPYLFHNGSKCRLISNHDGEHKSWEGLREPVGGPDRPTPWRCTYDVPGTQSRCCLVEGHPGVHLAPPDDLRGGVVRDVQILPNNRTAIHLTDGRTIYTRSDPMTSGPLGSDWPMTSKTSGESSPPEAPSPAPFVFTMPVEPPVGTVLVYQRQLGGGINTKRTYHYASIRAGNGLWYTTGQEARQGVSWHELCEVLATVGDVHTPTAWAPFGPFIL